MRRLRVFLLAGLGIAAAAWLLLAGDGGKRSEAETIELLTEIGDGHQLAYASNGGVTLLEFGTGSVSTVAQQVDALSVLEPFFLLYQGDRTLGVDPAEPAHLHVLVTGARLFATDTVDVYAFLESQESSGVVDQVFVGRLDSGFIGERLEVPAGASVIAFQGLGVLVTADDGSTWAPTANGFEQVAAGTVVSAVADAWVETTCEDGQRNGCETVFVDISSGETVPLRSDLASRSTLAISPDARWILHRDDDKAAFLDPRSGTSVAVDGAVDPDAIWSPDSSYVAWVADDSDTPILHVVFPSDRERLEIDLSILGATAPTGPALAML